MSRWELEIEERKVVTFDLAALQEKYERVWSECQEDYGDDAIHEFVVECYAAGPGDFQGTPHDAVEYSVTCLDPPVSS